MMAKCAMCKKGQGILWNSKGLVCRKCFNKKENKTGSTIFGKSNGKMVLIATQTRKSIFD